MGENTGIEWTGRYLEDGTLEKGYTGNFWWGCLKVSPGCANCYAESESARFGYDGIWGPAASSSRRPVKSIWSNLSKWDAKAGKDGVRRKVFVMSMGDFFEDHPDVADLRLHAMIALNALKNLDVLLLTKRIENVEAMAPAWMDNWPEHVWLGTSVEDQKRADERIPELMRLPAKMKFLSLEPLLGPVDLWAARYANPNGGKTGAVTAWPGGVQWVIAGGESGIKKRPMDLDAARGVREDCKMAHVPFFFKQIDKIQPIPDDLMVRQFPV